MVNKIGFKAVGQKKPDITPPNVLREQSKYFQLGKLQSRPKWWQVAVLLGIVVVITGVAAIYVVKTMWSVPAIDGSKYQAVFLEDGKVFFGKLRNSDGQYLVLENAYYTKSAASPVEGDTSEQTALIKVGSESYGPEPNIQIDRSHVLFWQNLRADSQISNAINNKINQ